MSREHKSQVPSLQKLITTSAISTQEMHSLAEEDSVSHAPSIDQQDQRERANPLGRITLIARDRLMLIPVFHSRTCPTIKQLLISLLVDAKYMFHKLTVEFVQAYLMQEMVKENIACVGVSHPSLHGKEQAAIETSTLEVYRQELQNPQSPSADEFSCIEALSSVS